MVIGYSVSRINFKTETKVGSQILWFSTFPVRWVLDTWVWQGLGTKYQFLWFLTVLIKAMASVSKYYIKITKTEIITSIKIKFLLFWSINVEVTWVRKQAVGSVCEKGENWPPLCLLPETVLSRMFGQVTAGLRLVLGPWNNHYILSQTLY